MIGEVWKPSIILQITWTITDAALKISFPRPVDLIKSWRLSKGVWTFWLWEESWETPVWSPDSKHQWKIHNYSSWVVCYTFQECLYSSFLSTPVPPTSPLIATIGDLGGTTFSTHTASRWCWEKTTGRNLVLALFIFRNTFKGKIQGAPLSVLPPKCRAWCKMNGCSVSVICSNYLRK